MYTYILLSIQPYESITDELTLRKVIQDAQTRSFGTTRSGTHLDILWLGGRVRQVPEVDEDECGRGAVVRIGTA